MIPPANLQRLAADVLRSSNINVDDQPDAEQIKSDMIVSLRSSIYTTLQSLIEPSMKVLIDGVNSRPELNFTIGTVLNWRQNKERWAVQPFDGKAILLRAQNLLPIFPQQEESQLKLFINQTRQITQSNAMNMLSTNEAMNIRPIIGQSYEICPFLLLHPVFRILGHCGRTSQLTLWANQLQGSVGKSVDRNWAKELRNQIKRSEGSSSEESSYSDISYSVFTKFEEEEIPAAYWFLLFVSLDAEEWIMGMECLDTILKDIKEDKWPKFFLIEALHFLALSEFGVKDKRSCQRMLKIYDSYADTNDRHRYSAAILQHWVDGTSADKYLEAINEEDSELQQLAKAISLSGWSSNEFSSHPWIAFKVASEIGAEYEGPHEEIITMIEAQWEMLVRFIPPHIWRENINEMKHPGFPHSVTVRHRKTKEKEREERERHERELHCMYEDR